MRDQNSRYMSNIIFFVSVRIWNQADNYRRDFLNNGKTLLNSTQLNVLIHTVFNYNSSILSHIVKTEQRKFNFSAKANGSSLHKVAPSEVSTA